MRAVPARAAFVLVVALLVVLWPVWLRRLGGVDPYLAVGAYSAVTVLLVMAFRRRGLRFERLGRDAVIGLAVGVVMTASTYALYALCVRLVPGLAAHVASLYVQASTVTVSRPAAIALTSVAVLAEELLWRGPILDGWHRGRALVLALSLGSYALAQLGTGSWIVALAAFVCGAVWTAERVLTRSIVASLVSHMIWTMTVIHLLPLTG